MLSDPHTVASESVWASLQNPLNGCKANSKPEMGSVVHPVSLTATRSPLPRHSRPPKPSSTPRFSSARAPRSLRLRVRLCSNLSSSDKRIHGEEPSETLVEVLRVPDSWLIPSNALKVDPPVFIYLLFSSDFIIFFADLLEIYDKICLYMFDSMVHAFQCLWISRSELNWSW